MRRPHHMGMAYRGVRSAIHGRELPPRRRDREWRHHRRHRRERVTRGPPQKIGGFSASARRGRWKSPKAGSETFTVRRFWPRRPVTGGRRSRADPEDTADQRASRRPRHAPGRDDMRSPPDRRRERTRRPARMLCERGSGRAGGRVPLSGGGRKPRHHSVGGGLRCVRDHCEPRSIMQARGSALVPNKACTASWGGGGW